MIWFMSIDRRCLRRTSMKRVNSSLMLRVIERWLSTGLKRISGGFKMLKLLVRLFLMLQGIERGLSIGQRHKDGGIKMMKPLVNLS